MLLWWWFFFFAHHFSDAVLGDLSVQRVQHSHKLEFVERVVVIGVEAFSKLPPELLLELGEGFEVPADNDLGAIETVLFAQLQVDLAVLDGAISLQKQGKWHIGGGKEIVSTEAIVIINRKLDAECQL